MCIGRPFHVCISLKNALQFWHQSQICGGGRRRRQEISYRLSTSLNQVGGILFTSSIISFASNPSFTHCECPPSLNFILHITVFFCPYLRIFFLYLPLPLNHLIESEGKRDSRGAILSASEKLSKKIIISLPSKAFF